MVGHCPTNKSRGEFLKILRTSSETETKNLNAVRNSIMKTKIYLYLQCFKSPRLQYETNLHVSKKQPFQTETVLVLVSTLDNIFSSIDNGNSGLSLCLDLSAAFDTINHQLLLSRLTKRCCVPWDCLKLISFLRR